MAGVKVWKDLKTIVKQIITIPVSYKILYAFLKYKKNMHEDISVKLDLSRKNQIKKRRLYLIL